MSNRLVYAFLAFLVLVNATAIVGNHFDHKEQLTICQAANRK